MPNIEISDDDLDRNFDSAAEEDLLGEDGDNLPGLVLPPTQYTPKPNTALNLPTSAEKLPQSSTSSMPADMCVVSS
jgi:hypothetical protein